MEILIYLEVLKSISKAQLQLIALSILMVTAYVSFSCTYLSVVVLTRQAPMDWQFLQRLGLTPPESSYCFV